MSTLAYERISVNYPFAALDGAKSALKPGRCSTSTPECSRRRRHSAGPPSIPSPWRTWTRSESGAEWTGLPCSGRCNRYSCARRWRRSWARPEVADAVARRRVQFEPLTHAPGLSKGAVVAPPLVDELEPPRRSSPIEAVTVSRHLILQFGKECDFVIVRHRALETLEPLLEFFHALPRLRERFRTDLLLWLDEACCAADNPEAPLQVPGHDEAND